jgi:site-specific recombinase XerD
MIDELFAEFEGAFAENTIRGYRNDFKRFMVWCEANGVAPLEANPEDLAAFAEHLAERCAGSTIRRHVASISSILKLKGREDIGKGAPVVLAMKRIYRRKGRWQRQAIPLTHDVLQALLAVCDDSPRGLRDRIMLRLGYETMRRRSELCTFRFEDLELLPSGKAALRLLFSKTDQYGAGKLIPISAELHKDIKQWSSLAGDSGYLLRRVYRTGDIGNALHPGGLSRRLQDLQQEAGLDLGGNLSGHSFRVGAALDLLEQGESLEKIMLRGGWQAESTVIKYLRAWQASGSFET